MIKRFHIENFKALVDFDLPPVPHELGRFTCLVGLNGAGKSTLLQAMGFVASLMEGKVKEWLQHRRWAPIDAASALQTGPPAVAGRRRARSRIIPFSVVLSDPDGATVTWSGKFNTALLRCTSERVESGEAILLEVNEGKATIAGARGGAVQGGSNRISFEYEGSILSRVKLDGAHPLLAWLKGFIQALLSLELLTPARMRGRARAAEDIGAGGESLAGFLAGLTTDEQYRLTKALEDFYPWVSWLDIKRLKWGWKSLTVHEAYEVGSVDIDAAHASDGFLRVLAILAQAQGDQSVLLFDEIENGINPELAEKLVDYLRGLDKQVIVTTHSPMILNYIPDEVAKEAVVLLYRTDDGQTKAARYFDAKLPSRKLGPMGPGEVFVDTPIEDVARYFAEGGGESDAPDSKEAWEE